MVHASEMKKLHEQMQRQIEYNNEKVEGQVNNKRKNCPQLKEGDKVYLLTKNMKTKRPSKKLDHVKVGPFLIKKVKGPVNYELELPPDAKVHPVFHVSLSGASGLQHTLAGNVSLRSRGRNGVRGREDSTSGWSEIPS